jgi:ABC-type transporter Mla subunit MlaD
MAIVTELVTKFSFKGSTAPLSKFSNGLTTTIGTLAKVGAGISALNGLVQTFAITTLQSSERLNQLSRDTGLAANQIQLLGGIAESTGSNEEAIFSTIENLSTKIGDAAQKGSEDFSRLGISVRGAGGHVKSTTQILNEVRGSFRRLGLSIREQKSFAEALGIDSSLLNMLGQSDSQIALITARLNKFGQVTAKQRKEIFSFNKEWNTLSYGFKTVKEQIAASLAPEITRMTSNISDLIAENKDWIINGVKKVVEGLSTLMSWITQLLPIFAVMTTAIIALKIATLGWAGAIGLLLSPAVIIGAVFVGIALVVDDLIAAFKGGNSVIANFFDGIVGKQGATKEFLHTMVEGFKQVFEIVKQSVFIIGDFFKLMANGLNTILQPMIDIYNKVSGSEIKLGKFDYSSDLFQGGQRFLSSGGQETSSRTTNANVTVNQVINTNDAGKAGEVAANNIQKQMQQTMVQTGNGGR